MKRIYISDVIHEHLKREARAEGRTLQWVVENRLTTEQHGTPPKNTPLPEKPDLSNLPDAMQEAEKNNLSATPKVDDIFTPEIDYRAGEFECCLNEQRPCKHWAWDTASGEGYRNVLSGRFLEVE